MRLALFPPAAAAPDDDVSPGADAATRSPIDRPAAMSGGPVSFAGNLRLTELPGGLEASSLNLSDCTALRALPDNLRVRRLNLSGCTALRGLPCGLHCFELDLRGTRIRSLPADLRVECRLDLGDCEELEALTDGLQVGSLVLHNCRRLEALPEGLDVCFLDVSGCTGLHGWPQRGRLRFGHLNVSDCPQISRLPDWLTGLAQLNVSGCARLAELPEGLRVTSWLDLADTAIRRLPASLAGTPLRWRGVPIDERIAFHPETITATEVLGEPNAERRRVLMERMGYETFLRHADARVLDRDRDPGGERRLLRVPLPGDEDLVCLAVRCPSTGRQYVLRVPPTIKSCRHAAAWIAGFDDPGRYQPIAET